MSFSYTDACGTNAATDTPIVNGGINAEGVTGALEGVVFTTSGFKFDTIALARLKTSWDAGVAAGTLTYIGKGAFANEGAEATFFENSDYNVRILQEKGTKVLEFRQVVCACTHAKLLELNGRTGRFFFQTKLGFILGRFDNDRAVQGIEGQIQIEFRPYPTSDNPVAETIMTITVSEPESDERNPVELTGEFQFSDIDQVYGYEALVTNESTTGALLEADLFITEDCNDTGVTGLVTGDLVVTDENGNTLAHTLTEVGNGNYSIDITTALTTAIINTAGTNGVITQNSILYYLGDTIVDVPA